MDIREVEALLRMMDENGIGFYNKKTMNPINHITASQYAARMELPVIDIDYSTLGTREYITSRHFRQLTKEKLKQQPTCEGCGNKAYKIYLKTWTKKGFEELDDVYSICNKCRVIDGEIVSHKQVKEDIEKEYENNEEFSDLVKQSVDGFIIKKAKEELRRI